MSLFRSILDKIFHHSATTAAAASAGVPKPAQQSIAASQQAVPAANSSLQRLQSVDVDAVLTELASTKGGGGNWRTSIVDLLKLLDLDSSLAARKGLAQELNVRAGADGSAEQNIALSKAACRSSPRTAARYRTA